MDTCAISGIQHVGAFQNMNTGIVLPHNHEAAEQTFVESKKTKGRMATSDEDEPSYTEEATDGGFAGPAKQRKSSPSRWQRMKWTDSMVKLLIAAVLYVGDDGGPADSSNDVNLSKKKCFLLQKKGKWKSISALMNRHGCCVSPQQCEDKFNDLNKRYKRLNDILGRGTACEVVEKPSLLESMDHLSAKDKEDARKLLSSKHLFYREMCSYHNSSGVQFPPDLDFQHSLQYSMAVRGAHGHDSCRVFREEEQNDVVNENEHEDGEEEEEDDHDENEARRRRRRKGCFSVAEDHDDEDLRLQSETMAVLKHNSCKSVTERKQWISVRMAQLEEKSVELQTQALELERQRFRWQRLTCKRISELQRMKLEVERRKLQNERLALLLKRKEIEIDSKSSDRPLNLSQMSATVSPKFQPRIDQQIQ